MIYKPLSTDEERIGRAVVDSAFLVHSSLGPGMLESIYEICFCYELEKHGFSFRRQLSVPIFYDGKKLDSALRLDILVQDLVICELKAVETMIPVFEAQLLSYMKLMHKRLGFLINFNVPLIKTGIKRLIL